MEQALPPPLSASAAFATAAAPPLADAADEASAMQDVVAAAAATAAGASARVPPKRKADADATTEAAAAHHKKRKQPASARSADEDSTRLGAGAAAASSAAAASAAAPAASSSSAAAASSSSIAAAVSASAASPRSNVVTTEAWSANRHGLRLLNDYHAANQQWTCNATSMRALLGLFFQPAMALHMTAFMPNVLLDLISEYAAPISADALVIPHPRGPFHLNESPWLLPSVKELREWALAQLVGQESSLDYRILAYKYQRERAEELDQPREAGADNLLSDDDWEDQFCRRNALRGTTEFLFELLDGSVDRVLDILSEELDDRVRELGSFCTLGCEQHLNLARCDRCAERKPKRQPTMRDFLA